MDILIRHQKSLTNLWLDLTAVGVACPKLASLALTVNIVEREWAFPPQSPPYPPPADALYANEDNIADAYDPIVLEDPELPDEYNPQDYVLVPLEGLVEEGPRAKKDAVNESESMEAGRS